VSDEAWTEIFDQHQARRQQLSELNFPVGLTEPVLDQGNRFNRAMG
jgi:hypothetical protein